MIILMNNIIGSANANNDNVKLTFEFVLPSWLTRQPTTSVTQPENDVVTGLILDTPEKLEWYNIIKEYFCLNLKQVSDRLKLKIKTIRMMNQRCNMKYWPAKKIIAVCSRMTLLYYQLVKCNTLIDKIRIRNKIKKTTIILKQIIMNPNIKLKLLINKKKMKQHCINVKSNIDDDWYEFKRNLNVMIFYTLARKHIDTIKTNAIQVTTLSQNRSAIKDIIKQTEVPIMEIDNRIIDFDYPQGCVTDNTIATNMTLPKQSLSTISINNLIN